MTILELVGASVKFFRLILRSALLKFKGAIRLIGLIFKSFSASRFALSVVVPCRPVDKNALWPTRKQEDELLLCVKSVCETGK